MTVETKALDRARVLVMRAALGRVEIGERPDKSIESKAARVNMITSGGSDMYKLGVALVAPSGLLQGAKASECDVASLVVEQKDKTYEATPLEVWIVAIVVLASSVCFMCGAIAGCATYRSCTRVVVLTSKVSTVSTQSQVTHKRMLETPIFHPLSGDLQGVFTNVKEA